MNRIRAILTHPMVYILILAFAMRIYNVGGNPPAITWDEASIGVNAYSIATFGVDEHGVRLPLDTFAAFGDYKPPIPVYLTVPFVWVFGLNEFSVRFPSVLAGTFTVWLLYCLVRELLDARGKKDRLNGLLDVPEWTAVVSALLLSVTPWHIMLSRAAFEANIAVCFLVWGVYLLFRARSAPALYRWAFLPFVALVYTFNSARYAGPLILTGVLVGIGRKMKEHSRMVGVGIVVALLAIAPILPHVFSKQARLRFEEVSIFTDLRTVLTSNQRREKDAFTWWSAIVHNRRVGYAREYARHFFDNLEPRFLFIRGDGNPKFSIQDSGQLLLVSAPFVAYGSLVLLSEYPQVFFLLLWWLIASIIPAAVARETPHALRVENGLPFYMIVTAYGLVRMARDRIGNKIGVISIIVVVLAFCLNVGYFWHTLMRHYPQEYSGEWQYGYKQAIELVKNIRDDYDTIVISETIGRPYIYTLFYEPSLLPLFLKDKDASFDAAGFYNVYGYGKYRFTKEGIGEYKGRVLYILPPKDVPEGIHTVETIKLLNGDPVLVAFEK